MGIFLLHTRHNQRPDTNAHRFKDYFVTTDHNRITAVTSRRMRCDRRTHVPGLYQIQRRKGCRNKFRRRNGALALLQPLRSYRNGMLDILRSHLAIHLTRIYHRRYLIPHSINNNYNTKQSLAIQQPLAPLHRRYNNTADGNNQASRECYQNNQRQRTQNLQQKKLK